MKLNSANVNYQNIYQQNNTITKHNSVVRRNFKKIRKFEPHERKYLNITNASYILKQNKDRKSGSCLD